MYTAYACHEIEQPEDKIDALDTYKKNYNGKTDAKFDVFEAENIKIESQKRAANTGIKILRNLARETIEDITYVTEIQSGNTRIDITKTICVMDDNVDTSKLFTDILM